MWVKRIQYAVGQGGFHAAAIFTGTFYDHTTLPAYTYVYDCGSVQNWALASAIDRFVACFGNIDVLFVSHLDHDHVNGIDSLLSRADVDTVYLPYVNDVSLVLDLLEADGETGLNGSLIEAALDPAGWFGRRGVRRVIRIGPGGPEGTDGPYLPIPSPKPASDHSEIISKIGPHDATILARGQEGSRAELCEVTPGSSIVFTSDSALLDWVLIPHVTPAPRENVNAFTKAMKSALGLEGASDLTSAELLKGLAKSATRKKMKDAYEAIIAGGSRRMHNRVSMSLYSGPTGKSGSDWTCTQHLGRRSHHTYYGDWQWRGTVGWLGTGDATLKVEEVWRAFRATYAPVFDNVITLGLPHHGSIYNFRTDLTALPSLKLAVANASEASRKHPSPDVIRAMNNSGTRTWIVSQESSSELEELVWQAH